MTQAHAERAHAVLSPSASHRWMECPGSVRKSEGIARTSSVFADEGTAAHELAAHCLINGYNAERFSDWFVNIDTDKERFGQVDPPKHWKDTDRVFEVDDEMVDGVQVYLDYLRGQNAPGDEMDVEFRFDLQHIADGMFGTGDCVIYRPSTGHLLVADFKYGRGVPVDPKENPQLLCYGLGAVKRHGNRPLSKVTLAIIQPRCRHPEGSIRVWETNAVDLLDFEADLRKAAAATTATDAPLHAGDWCKFCPAAAICEVNQAKVDEIVGLAFAPDGEDPAEMTPEKLSATLDKVDIVDSWVKRVRAHAHDTAVGGMAIPGWKLVDKRATRRWISEEDVEKELKVKYDLGDDEIYERKMKSPAEMEKLMPGKNKDVRSKMIAPLVTKQSSGVVLVPATDKRPAAKTDGSEFDSVEI